MEESVKYKMMEAPQTVAQIEYVISQLKSKIKEIQDDCNHEKADFEYRSDTGNYDRGADRYWKAWHCPDCNKRWDEYQ